MPALAENARRLDGPPAEVKAALAEHRALCADLDGVELRGDDGKITFVGHAAVFDRLSEDLGGFRERIQRGAFRKVLDTNPDVRFRSFDHDGLPLARTASGTLELREDPKGLRVYAELAPIQASEDLRVLVQRGDVSQMSFAFTMRDTGAGPGNDVWAEEEGGLVRTIVSFGGLMDVTPVAFPAYRATDASMRSLVCGIEVITIEGDVRADLLRDVSWKIHNGELEATVEERAAVDAAYARTDTVSPWVMERALRAASQEPELRAVIPGKRATVVLEDTPSGEPNHFRLAARQRRLRALTPTSMKETQP